MADQSYRVGDIGTVFTVTITENGSAVDVSSATVTKQIIFKKGDGSALVKNASFTTNGSDGKITCTMGTTDLSIEGTWAIQGKVVISAGTFLTQVATFRVEPSLPTV